MRCCSILLAAGEGRYRGVALLEPSTSQAEVERLDEAGVRGVRLHFYFRIVVSRCRATTCAR